MSLFLAIWVFLVGLIIGSFLNCFIWRLYKNETIGGRSYCPKCRQAIAWFDNIPVLSFFLLRGRCRHCRQNISWQYPLVEVATGLIFCLIWLKDFSSPAMSYLLLRDCLIAITLIIVFVYDWRWQMVPMLIVWPMSFVVLIVNIFLGYSLVNIAICGAVAAAFFLIQYIITKRRGIGEGDIWLGLFLGLAFPSLLKLLLIMFLAYGSGTIISLSLMAYHKKGWKSKIALGPFLAFGAIITLIWGEQILAWYSALL